MIASPLLEPNCAPARKHTFSLHGSLRYTLYMSVLRTSISFRDERRSAPRTLSLDTTDAYVTLSGGSVLWPPETNHDFLVNSIFTSNTIWKVISLYATEYQLPSSLKNNATFTISIYFLTVYLQYSVPESLSIWYNSSTFFGS